MQYVWLNLSAEKTLDPLSFEGYSIPPSRGSHVGRPSPPQLSKQSSMDWAH